MPRLLDGQGTFGTQLVSAAELVFLNLSLQDHEPVLLQLVPVPVVHFRVERSLDAARGVVDHGECHGLAAASPPGAQALHHAAHNPPGPACLQRVDRRAETAQFTEVGFDGMARQIESQGLLLPLQALFRRPGAHRLGGWGPAP